MGEFSLKDYLIEFYSIAFDMNLPFDVEKAAISLIEAWYLRHYNKKVKPLGNVSLFGWKPGWLGVYIIFSIIFSMVLRKLLKIH